MSKIKKITAILLSAVMLVCCLSVGAGAESIADTAKAISSGKTYTAKLYKSSENADYKIKLSKSGDLKLNITTQMYQLDVYLYDTNGNLCGALDFKADTGTTGRGLWENKPYCPWNKTVEKYSGSFKYSLDKGTYYLRLKRYNNTGSEKVTFKATFPSSDKSSDSDDEADCITVQMKKGGTLQLAFGDDAKWTSSDKSVVTVTSGGKITAKKAGTAVITAKSDSKTDKIKIKVTK